MEAAEKKEITEVNEDVKLDAEGNPIVEEVIEPELDEDGNPIVVEKEAWMGESVEKEEEPDSIPLASFLKQKGKLKGQVKERDLENEQLKERIKALESTIQTPSASQPLKRPRERDFDTDEEYDDAIDKWDEQRLANIANNLTQTNTQQTQQEQQQQSMVKNMEDHYGRADGLIKEHRISQDVYVAADKNVRNAIEAIMPNQGAFDFLISKLGAGSEKVVYYLGNNENERAKLQAALANDRLGIEASMLLGEMKKKLELTKIKQTSQARPPATQVKGGGALPISGKAAKKKYDATPPGQAQYEIRSAAKKAGIDTKEW